MGGKSKKASKKVREGTLRRSKGRPLSCKKCGRFFSSLGEVNQHYKAVGHTRKKHPSKKMKFSKDYTAAEIQQIEVLFHLLKNPMELRQKIRDHLDRRRPRDVRRY